MTTQQMMCPILVGRAHEMQQLQDRLRLSVAGQGQTVLIAGEAGVGKSRLLAELKHTAITSGFQLLQGNCFESDLLRPYAPFTEVLHAYAREGPPALLADRLGPDAAVLLPLVPHLASSFPSLREHPSPHPELERQRFFEAVWSFLERQASISPVLFVMEDVHWSDDSSRALFHFLARRVGDMRVLFVLSYRLDEAPLSLIRWLGRLEQEFMGKVVGDLATTFSSAMVLIGDKLGLYKAMAGAGPLTSAELAQRTATTERYVREWLLNQAASGYLEYDPETGRYSLPDEHALALADEQSPVFVQGGFQIAMAMLRAEPRIAESFRTGAGMPWGEHDPGLFVGTERFFGTLYAANLVSTWIPALRGVGAKLEAGATVADIGCGHGASTILLAQAFPRSRFFGYDNHAPSIQHARQAAAEAGVTERVTFERATATDYPSQGSGYDLIAFFDCFHDLGTPIEVATHASAALAKEGTVLLVEPMAGEHIEDSLNPVGRLYSAGSILCCTPNALASGGVALGNQATDQQLREVWQAGGLNSFRRAITTPFNRVFEVQAERFYPL